VGAVTVKLPLVAPLAYLHAIEGVFGAPTLKNPTQSFAGLPEGAVQFTVTVPPGLTVAGVAVRLNPTAFTVTVLLRATSV
jgi:hypothetical protein